MLLVPALRSPGFGVYFAFAASDWRMAETSLRQMPAAALPRACSSCAVQPIPSFASESSAAVAIASSSAPPSKHIWRTFF